MRHFLILLAATNLVACSSAQKSNTVAVQQRVPLSEDMTEEIKKHIEPITMGMFKSLRNSLYQVHKPEYKLIVKDASHQNYWAPWMLLAGAVASVPVVFAAGPLVSPAFVGAGVSGLASGMGALWVDLLSHNYWPKRIKIRYHASHKSSGQHFEGHCSAYFFTGQNEKNRAGQAEGDKLRHRTFSVFFEVDGCTHENIFPENKKGKLRVGHEHDTLDATLGQTKVVATGIIKVELKDTLLDTAPNVRIPDKRLLQISTNIQSHKKKLKPITVQLGPVSWGPGGYKH